MRRALVEGFERWRDSVVEQAQELCQEAAGGGGEGVAEHGGG